MRKIYLLAAAALSLAACQPEHASWRSQCVESHTELMPQVTMMPDGRGGMYPMTSLQQYEQCDRTAMVCVAGKDGSTVCPAIKE